MSIERKNIYLKSTTLIIDSTESSKEVHCFVHAVSPIKKAHSSNRKYFNCILQAREKVSRAVCFSPEKHTELQTIQQIRSPVKIENFGKSSNNESGDIIIHKYTKILPVEKDDVGFSYLENLTASGFVSISSIGNLAAEQLISVKAQVARLGGVKMIETQYQGSLKKQEAVIRDTTGSIKVVLWQNNVNTLEENKTYNVQNLRVKSSNNEKYLNTPKGEEFIYTETTPFEHPCVNVEEDMSDMVATTVSARFLGIHQASFSLSCISCNKKVVALPEDDLLVECQNCHLTQLIGSCNSQWCVRLLVQPSKDSSRKLRLTFYNEQVNKLMSILGVTVDLNTASERDILLVILRNNKTVNITYDSLSFKVTDISI